MVLVLFASVFAMVGFYLLLSVVPLYTEAAGGGSSSRMRPSPDMAREE